MQKIQISVLLLISLCFCFGLSAETGGWSFSDPLDGMVPFPIPPDALHDPALSDLLGAILHHLRPEDSRGVVSYHLPGSLREAEEFYSERLPVQFSPVKLDMELVVERLGDRNKELKIGPVSGVMTGKADGGLTLYSPYYDFVRSEWCEGTLLVLIR